MMGKFGVNGGQVERFIEAARELSFESVGSIIAETRSDEVWDARERVSNVRLPAARYSAIDSAVRKLSSFLMKKYPVPTTTAGRMQLNSFSFLLEAAVFALSSRSELDDDTVGLVVDPFAKRLGFEWRSWGVGSGTAEGETDG